MTKASLKALLDRLYARQNFGMKMGLDVEAAILSHLGNPERSFGVIHVAGTNGKGSVCAMLDSVLREAGIRVGLYTSPHLIRFNERIRVDGAEISDAELAALFEKTEPWVEAVARECGREPTFFECTTAMAFQWFSEQAVKLAVVETGLGGRLDATNVVLPLVSVITPISVEHTRYLGTDVASIAAEKCGIIKAGRPVVAAAMHPDAVEVIRRVAAERRSPLSLVEDQVRVRCLRSDLDGQRIELETERISYGTVSLPLLGPYQASNVATSAAVIDVLNDIVGLPISEAVVKRGMQKVSWPGRCQVLSHVPPVILDGAHNPGGGKVLAETLRLTQGRGPIGLVVGMCDDKDLAGFLGALQGLIRKCWAVPLSTERSLPAERVADEARRLGWDVEMASVRDALDASVRWALEVEGAVCVAGSLFLAGEVLALREGNDGKGTP